MNINELLPITIENSQDLIAHFSKLSSITNRLEAQINFQTLTANWYGNEEDILHVKLHLVTQDEFVPLKSSNNSDFLEAVADDVFSDYQISSNNLHCFIAITPSELILLQQQQKLLTHYIQIKVHGIAALPALHW